VRTAACRRINERRSPLLTYIAPVSPTAVRGGGSLVESGGARIKRDWVSLAALYDVCIQPTAGRVRPYCKGPLPRKGLKFCGRHCYLRYSVEVAKPIETKALSDPKNPQPLKIAIRKVLQPDRPYRSQKARRYS
jgi:hypothetical protein